MKKIFVLLAAAAAVSCGRTVTPETVPAAVRIDPVITRATEVNFENGDRIGVTITKPDNSVFASNAVLTYADGTFSGDQKWYADGGETSALTAYYPYAETGWPATFTVGADQDKGAGRYDLMLASKTGVKPQEAPVTMVFQHQLSQVVVNLDNLQGVTIAGVTLKGLLPTIGITLDSDGKVVSVPDQSAAKIDIEMEAVQAGTRYRAIVVPQTMAFGLSIRNAAGGSVVQNFTEVTMKPGYSYTISAKVTAAGVVFVLDGEIEAWLDGGEIQPDGPGENPDTPGDDFEEQDTWFTYGGKRYEKVTLANGQVWMAEPLAYVPAGMTVSDDPASGDVWYPYSTDGTNVTVLKDEASIKAKGYLYSYNALLATEITADNFDKLEGAQGICPPGWHIPSRQEWFVLCGNSNRSALLGEPTGTKIDNTALFYDKTLNYAPVSKFNDAGFNFTLSGSIGNSKYSALMIDSSVSDVESYFGQNRMAYVAASTANSATQFFALMTTFTLPNAKGKVSLSYATLGKVGVQVRCIKDR